MNREMKQTILDAVIRAFGENSRRLAGLCRE
jgi:hypothetical protein